MGRRIIAISTLLAASISFPAVAADLAEQMDIVAPIINAEGVEALGGPDNSESVISGIDGRWFSLANMVGNWGDDGVGFGPADLENSRERNCADDADYIMEQVVTGPTSFEIHETFARYDNAAVTQAVTLAEGRRFTVSVDEEQLLLSYGIDSKEDARAKEILEIAPNRFALPIRGASPVGLSGAAQGIHDLFQIAFVACKGQVEPGQIITIGFRPGGHYSGYCGPMAPDVPDHRLRRAYGAGHRLVPGPYGLQRKVQAFAGDFGQPSLDAIDLRHILCIHRSIPRHPHPQRLAGPSGVA